MGLLVVPSGQLLTNCEHVALPLCQLVVLWLVLYVMVFITIG